MSDDPYLAYLNRRIDTLDKAMSETPASSRSHTRLSSQKTALLGARARYQDTERGDCDECGTGGGGLCPECKDDADVQAR